MIAFEFAAQPGLARDLLIADLWAVGTCGIVERDDSLEAYFESNGAFLSQLLQKHHGHRVTPAPTQPTEKNDDECPVLLGRNYAVVSRYDAVIPNGRQPLYVAQSDAFGSGRHESTQLVIEALEEMFEGSELHTGQLVLDVGCGSGVIAQAAIAIGLRAVACDIHIGSLEAAHRDAPHLPLFAGSLDSVRAQTADLLVANISARVIDRLAPYLLRVLKSGRPLVLAGFISQQPPHAFTPARIVERNDWACWVCYPGRDGKSATALPALQPFEQRWW